MNSNDHTYINTTKLNQMLFDQELYINKCSSYIDAQKQYMLAEMILNTHHNNAELKTPVGRNCKSKRNNNSKVDSIDHIVNQTVTATVTKTSSKPQNSTAKSSIKKFRQVISNKLKKLVTLHNSPDELNFNGKSEQPVVHSKSTKRKSFGKTTTVDTSIKLVNFNYQSNFVHLEQSSTKRHTPAAVRSTPRFVNNTPRAYNRRDSTGRLSSSSSASSLDSNQFLYTSDSQPEQQKHQQSSCNNFYESSALVACNSFPVNLCATNNSIKEFVETSTPIFNNRIRPIQLTYANQASFLGANTFLGGHASQIELNPMCDFDSENNDDEVNVALLMDQSTQVMIDSPVLVESTFNTSSLSNLSDDLIILQTASKPRFTAQPIVNSTAIGSVKAPKSNKRKAANQLSDRFRNDSLVKNSKMPRWANGHELNMALVNQLYFNPSGHGVFTLSSSLSMNQPSAFL